MQAYEWTGCNEADDAAEVSTDSEIDKEHYKLTPSAPAALHYLSHFITVARSRASAAAAASQKTAKGKGKQPAEDEQDDEDDRLDELDLVEDSDPEDDEQPELDLPPPLRSREAMTASTSRAATQDINGAMPNGTAGPMPTPTLGQNDENEEHCIKVPLCSSSHCFATTW